MHKILITGKIHRTGIERLQNEADFEVDFKPDLPYDEVIKIIGEYDCIVSRSETTIDKNMIDHATKLSVISRAAVGVNNIDVDYATEKGILVLNTPGKNTTSAAELAIGLILSVLRTIPQAHSNMKENRWERHKFAGTELCGKKVGIIGLGNVGKHSAQILNGFECELLAYDPYVSEKYCRSNNCKKVELDELFRESDIITLHVPRTKDTINIIDADAISKMKDGVVIVNAARGGVVNEKALEEGLRSGKIGAAGIDTFEKEPLIEHPLKEFNNVVFTPHIGGSTEEAQYKIGTTVAEETVKALRGGIVNTPVNLPQLKTIENDKIANYSVLAKRLGSFSHQFNKNHFTPQKIEILYRGALKEDDWALIKLSFIKGFLQGTTDRTVSYVNALQIAEEKGYEIVEKSDENFTDYESAIRVTMTNRDKSFSIGGTVFGEKQLRLSYLNGFVFEVEPVGNMLVIENQDMPGVIGHVGTVLSQNKINISQFELSRELKGGIAMAIVLVDEHISESVLQNLTENKSIRNIRLIDIA